MANLPNTGTLSESGGEITISELGAFILTATVTDANGRVTTDSRSITVANTAPTVAVTATPNRTTSGGKFLVTIDAVASDADGDATEIEYDSFASDNYYAAGTYTVRARAKNASGTYGEWVSKTFTIFISAPTTPVVTRTPTGNCVTPGTAVSINATSTDADGDAITYVWESRPSASYVNGLGSQVVRVKAVDSTGAESPWAAIIFFVASSSNGGGMMLTARNPPLWKAACNHYQLHVHRAARQRTQRFGLRQSARVQPQYRRMGSVGVSDNQQWRDPDQHHDSGSLHTVEVLLLYQLQLYVQ